jgi:Uma2 family endonuclease
MSLALLDESPIAPPSELGPHRRKDYEALPDEPRCELIFGRFYVSPSPTSLHQMLVLLLARLLDDIAVASGGLALTAPMDVALDEHSVVQPDLIYLLAEHRDRAVERVEGAPDLVVEVLSPGTARRDRGEKLRLYAESGVREYWIVDPAERQIEFLVNEGGRFVVALPADREYRSPALAELRLDLVALWRAVDERLPSKAG